MYIWRQVSSFSTHGRCIYVDPGAVTLDYTILLLLLLFRILFCRRGTSFTEVIADGAESSRPPPMDRKTRCVQQDELEEQATIG